MQEGGGTESRTGDQSTGRAAARGDRRRTNGNYRYFGTVLFLGALAMILLMVLLHR